MHTITNWFTFNFLPVDLLFYHLNVSVYRYIFYTFYKCVIMLLLFVNAS